jgi:AcrR family transcriptional regulator
MARSAGATRERIVDAAYGLFWQQGFVRASLDDIAARADVTKRTLYQHFRSKDDLMAEVLARTSDLALNRLQQIADRLPTEKDAMLDAMFAELAEWSEKPRWAGPGFTRVVSELADLPGHPARKIAREHKAAAERWYADLLKRAGVQSADARGREIILLVEGAMALMLIHGDSTYAKAAADAAKRLINGKEK